MYQYLGNTGILLYNSLGIFSLPLILWYHFAQYSRKRKLLSGTGRRVQSWFARKTNGQFLSGERVWVALEILLFASVQWLLIGPLNVNFGPLVATGANYFGTLFFMPLILMALSTLLGTNPMKQLDLLTPAFPLILTFTKAACFCQGCCRGIKTRFGMFNHATQSMEFPVQLVEMFFAICIFIILLKWRDKVKEGAMYPIYAILYSGTRFFSEFLRCEENVWGILKTYHILCILGMIYGIAGYLLVGIFREKINQRYQ